MIDFNETPEPVERSLDAEREESASAGTQTPGVRNGTGCMRARRRFSNGGRPWPTPHED
jgi:hypothetical protein